MEYGISGYQTDYRFMKKEVIQLAHETVPLTGTEQVDQIYLLGTKEDDNLKWSNWRKKVLPNSNFKRNGGRDRSCRFYA